VLLLGENQSTYIPLGAMHRLRNPARCRWRSSRCSRGATWEDDIVRFEDTYGRGEEPPRLAGASCCR
jgi:mannose-1-phosphate guanylyltransferase/mannose-6-phosphate isomerase